MRYTSEAAALCGLAIVGMTSAAFGQDSGTHFALNRLDPAPAGDSFFGVPSAKTEGRLAFRAMVFADYGYRPLDVTTTNTGMFMTSVVAHQAAIHGNVTVNLYDRVALNLDFPAVIQSGDTFSKAGTTLPAPETLGTGNVRLGARSRLWNDGRGFATVALGGYLYLPTNGDYASDAKLRSWLHAVASGEALTRLRYAVAVGPELRQNRELLGTNQGSRLTYTAAVAALLGKDREFQVGPEVLGTVAFDGSTDRSRTTNIDVLVGGRWTFAEEFTLGAGAGTTLSAGVGSPRARGMLSLTWAPELDVAKKVKVADQDGDGVLDPDDACVTEAGVASAERAKNGCPAVDRDGDGVLDANDACVAEAGVASADPSKSGCPVVDRDGDGVPDTADACPDKAGSATGDAKSNGCPAAGDSDGDGIADDADACVSTKGVASADPKANGCAADADGDGVTDDVDACPAEAGPDATNPAHRGCSIRAVLDKTALGVEFESGKAQLKATSEPVVEALAALLKEHVELVKLEVQAHTDNQGAKRINKTISQDRAGSLVAAIVRRGVAGTRLVAKGYGDEQPIAGNDTPEGQAKNRRIQFIVLEKK